MIIKIPAYTLGVFAVYTCGKWLPSLHTTVYGR